MSIGYACKLIGVPNTDMKACTLKNASDERLTELMEHNINSLSNIIDYNIRNNIRLFRISSDLIPFGSSEFNHIKWWKVFQKELVYIGGKIKNSGMRVSMHPGQYTVLNSNKIEVVKKAVDDLIYHTRILDSMELNQEHKIVIHIGGAYDSKILSKERFVKNYKTLPEEVKKRLIIENDDKIYTIEEVLSIGIENNIPVVFDNLHNEINAPEIKRSEIDWINKCRDTWKKEDGTQKIHYSQQAEGKRTGSHSNFIAINEFMNFYNTIDKDIDIMLEVKDKNLSCIKCINCTTPHLKISRLEEEWSKYKYTVLEKSHNKYLQIRQHLKNKNNISPNTFYTLLEESLKSDGNKGSQLNSILHVWGYFKSSTSYKEKENFFRDLEKFEANQIGINAVKKHLKKLSEKYNSKYLLSSYYFYI